MIEKLVKLITLECQTKIIHKGIFPFHKHTSWLMGTNTIASRILPFPHHQFNISFYPYNVLVNLLTFLLNAMDNYPLFMMFVIIPPVCFLISWRLEFQVLGDRSSLNFCMIPDSFEDGRSNSGTRRLSIFEPSHVQTNISDPWHRHSTFYSTDESTGMSLRGSEENWYYTLFQQWKCHFIYQKHF